MIFTSYTYVCFLAVVFVIHGVLPIRARNTFLLAASYVFYAAWKWEFVFLLLGLSLFNWGYARWILPRASTVGPLVIGVCANLGALLYFKYTNFIVANASALAQLFGSHWTPRLSDIILPLGISFFTFQGIAYLFDVATGELPIHSLTDFLLFKALWPQLIAGPIIRLHEIRDQLSASARRITTVDVAEGSRRILAGFFKKVVFADNLAPFVEMVFLNRGTPAALDVLAGVFGFALQIYFDFSGYSDIAIGSARLFGFRFPENFDWPYIARSPQEFWNRWHMTLSRWIRDYVYTPLSYATRARPALAPLWLLFAMAVCGLWHGAQWTFVAWGVWHGVLLIVSSMLARRKDLLEGHRTVRSVVSWALTMAGVCIGWLLFRAVSLTQAAALLRVVASGRGGMRPSILRENEVIFIGAVCTGLLLLQGAKQLHARLPLEVRHRAEAARHVLRPVAYVCAIVAIIVFDQEAKTFVYFQF